MSHLLLPSPRIALVDGVRHVHLQDPRGPRLHAQLALAHQLDLATEVGIARVAKYRSDWTWEEIAEGKAGRPYEIVHGTPQLLMNGGVSCLWQCLIGNGTSTANQTLTFFSNARAAIGIGDSTTAVAATQNDLQAATNKLRKAMDASYPSHTDGTTSGAQTIQFQATFSTADANYTWNEWGVFNSTSAGTGRMLNRKVESLGTKTSASTWVMLIAMTLS